MLIKTWTFLVTRNQSIDYNTVVAPDFISQAQIRSLLNKASDIDSFEDGKVFIRWIKGSKLGDFTIVFRSAKARRRDIEDSGNDDILKDPFGREISLINGLVFREKPDQILGKIRHIHLVQINKELKEQYRKFWNDDKISDSHVIDLKEDVSSPTINLEELKPLLMDTNSQLPDVLQNRKIASKSTRKNVRLYIRIFASISVLLLLIFLGKIIGSPGSKWTEFKKCQYSIITKDFSFENNKEKDGSKRLKALIEEKSKAWIFLTGSVKVNSSDKKSFDSKISQDQPQISSEQSIPSILIREDEIKMTYHPINAAIGLLENQTIISGKLQVIIVDSVNSEQINQCSILEGSKL